MLRGESSLIANLTSQDFGLEISLFSFYWLLFQRKCISVVSRGGSWLKSWWFCSTSSSFAVFGSCAAADRWVPIAWPSPFPLFSLIRSSSRFGFAVGRNETWASGHWESLAEET